MKALGILVLLLLPSLYFAWNYADMPHFGRHHDDTIYYESAKSLAQGTGYRLHSYPGDPPATKYPPGYPWLLAAVWWLWPEFPANLHAVNWLSWLLLPPFLWLTRAIFLDFGIGEGLSWVLTAWVAVNALTIALSVSAMSDLPFTVLLLLTVLMLERGKAPGLLVGAIAGVAFLVRATALPLLGTVPLILWLKGRRKDALLFAAAMLPFVAGWQLWARANQVATSDSILLYYTSYAGFHFKHVGWHNLGDVVWLNLNGLVSRIGHMLVYYPDDSFIFVQLYRLATFAAVAGVVRLVRRTGRWHYALYGLGLSGMLLLWTFPPIPRFLFPLMTLFAAGFGAEMHHMAMLMSRAWRQPKPGERAAVAIFGGIVGILLLFVAYTAYAGVTVLVPNMVSEGLEFKPHRSEAYEWIRANTSYSDVILAYDDVLLHLYTGRKTFASIMPPQVMLSNDVSALEREVAGIPGLMRDRGSKWVLWTEKDFARDWPATTSLREMYDAMPELIRVWDSGHAAVYRLK